MTCVSCGAFLLLGDTVRFRDDFVCLGCREDFVRQQDEAKLAEEARDTPDEEMREAELKHERRIRTAAVMYYFVGVLLSVLAIGSLVNGKPGVMVICLLFAVPVLFAAREVMGFRRRAKLAACCVSGFGLILLPLGSVLHLYVLYLVCNKGAKQVFTEHYREVIDRTPHLKPGISWIVAVLLCILHFVAFQVMG